MRPFQYTPSSETEPEDEPSGPHPSTSSTSSSYRGARSPFPRPKPPSSGSVTEPEDGDVVWSLPAAAAAGPSNSASRPEGQGSSNPSATAPGPVAQPSHSSSSLARNGHHDRPSPRRRRSSSSSSIVLLHEQPEAGPSRARFDPPPRRRPEPSSDESDIEFQGQHGPRDRRTGRAMFSVSEALRRHIQERQLPAPPRSLSPVPPPENVRRGGIRLGGAIIREGGVNYHLRPSAAAYPPPPQNPPPQQPAHQYDGGFRGAVQAFGGRIAQAAAEAFNFGGLFDEEDAHPFHIGGDHIYHGPPVRDPDWYPYRREPHYHRHVPLSIEDEWKRVGGFAELPRVPTTRGFTRNFEREFGGYVSDSDDDDEDPSSLGQPIAGPSTRPLVDSTPSILDLTDEDDEDEDIAVVEPDGLTSIIHTPHVSALHSPAPRASVPSSTVNAKKRKAASLEEAPNLMLVCAGCNRPLILQATSAGRKSHVLSCGHIVDGHCLGHLSSPTPPILSASTAPSDLASSASTFLASVPSPRTRAKGKGRAPPKPKKKLFKWHCPVDSCDREHTSEGLPVELGVPQMGETTVYQWKPKVGKGGIIPLYI